MSCEVLKRAQICLTWWVTAPPFTWEPQPRTKQENWKLCHARANNISDTGTIAKKGRQKNALDCSRPRKDTAAPICISSCPDTTLFHVLPIGHSGGKIPARLTSFSQCGISSGLVWLTYDSSKGTWYMADKRSGNHESKHTNIKGHHFTNHFVGWTEFNR